jgi:hypothetical protein
MEVWKMLIALGNKTNSKVLYNSKGRNYQSLFILIHVFPLSQIVHFLCFHYVFHFITFLFPCVWFEGVESKEMVV